MSENTISKNTTIPVSKKRLIRLLTYFRPYRFLIPKLCLSIKTPLVLSNNQAKTVTNRKHIIHIYAPLLSSICPEWVEPTILRCALRMYQYRYGMFAHEIESLSLYQHLHTLQEELLAQSTLPTLPTLPKAGDANVSLRKTWDMLHSTFFPDHNFLAQYSVEWAPRKRTQCLASCNVVKHRVLVAKAMQHPSCIPYTEPLLYHEMCHAVLGPPKRIKGRWIYHGKDFRTLESRHPTISSLNTWIRTGGWVNAVSSYYER